MRLRSLALAVLALGLAATPSPGQDSLSPGSRIRVTEATAVHRGRFQAVRESALVLESGRGTLALPLAGVTRLERSDGRRASTAGGIVGLLVGGAAGGFALGCLANRDDYGVLCGGQNDTKLVVGALGGGALGAVAGALLFRRERWRPVALPGSIAPTLPVPPEGTP